MTRKEASLLVYKEIKDLYEESEAHLISRYFIDDLCSMHETIDADEDFFLKLSELSQGKPLQYVTHKAYFYGHEFYVDERVLIPRPETEELVRAVLEYSKKEKITSIIDIGTGSGCIPITLKLQNPELEVTGIDVSAIAIEVACLNAKFRTANVSFFQFDILDSLNRKQLKDFDLVVSNPPYIGLEEANTLPGHVFNYEPHLALFSPGDPLLFYREIVLWAKEQNDRTALFMEINEQYGEEVREILLTNGYSGVEIIKDLQCKDRIISGVFQH